MSFKKKNEEAIASHEIKVLRSRIWDNGEASFDMVINGVIINGCLVKFNSKQEPWIAFPSYKGKDGNWYNHAFVKLSPADIESISTQIADNDN